MTNCSFFKFSNSGTWLFIFSILLILNSSSIAQNYKPTPNDTLRSISLLPDGRVIFQVYAPKAADVKLGGTDIPDKLRNEKMMKHNNGVWEVTIGPLVPGAYRYNFIIDDIAVLDPRNPTVSESNTNSWSLVYIPGSGFMDIKDIAHGAVSEVTYYSHSLNRFRRMHIYTPPGYESGNGKYPVFYLLHGAFDCDDSWPTVGRAGIILDNLIAEKKAVPMVVVMPAGHTAPFAFSIPAHNSIRPAVDEFVEDFLKDIKPYTEKNYRIIADRKSRAIAGLSMGGAQTLNIAIPDIAEFSYVGVYSSGIFELNRAMSAPGADNGLTWEERNIKVLEDKELKKGLDLLWFATGKDDFLLGTTRMTVDLLKKHGFDVVFKETNGGHTWNNWRDYLYEFTPLLFKSNKN